MNFSMNQLISILFILNSVFVFGQNQPENYFFLQDLYKKIEEDSTAWKYQVGATELSFIGRYSDVLKMWDKNGVGKQSFDKKDKLYFTKSKKINAKEYILEQSKNAKITIINEAHHIAKHRTFTKSLLQGLYDNGYRYLGLEALFDTTINDRKYLTVESGYYTKEPEFGNLIAEALETGFVVFGYEASDAKNGKEREIQQAENIQKFMENHIDGKVLIHCGYAHVFENEYPPWGKAMAGRLKENLKTDPLTIDQTMFLEKSDKENNHLFIQLNKANYPIVLIDKNEQVFNGLKEPKQTDIVILHPKTEFINNRPDWYTEGKQKYVIPHAKIENNKNVIVFAYRHGEFENKGIPADLLEISDEFASAAYELYLKKGKYEIVIKDRNYNIVEKYNIEIK